MWSPTRECTAAASDHSTSLRRTQRLVISVARRGNRTVGSFVGLATRRYDDRIRRSMSAVCGSTLTRTNQSGADIRRKCLTVRTWPKPPVDDPRGCDPNSRHCGHWRRHCDRQQEIGCRRPEFTPHDGMREGRLNLARVLGLCSASTRPGCRAYAQGRESKLSELKNRWLDDV